MNTEKDDVMQKILLGLIGVLMSGGAHAQVISLEDVVLPTDLSDNAVLELAEGFCADGNEEQLTSLTLGVADRRAELLIDVFQDIAKNCPETAGHIVYTIQGNLPDIALSSFAMMDSYLQDYNEDLALTELHQTNNHLRARLFDQGLDVETAAGVETAPALDFDDVLEAIDVPEETSSTY